VSVLLVWVLDCGWLGLWVQVRFLGMMILDLASRVWLLGSGYRVGFRPR